jgi:SAM-dependent methyltransferase
MDERLQHETENLTRAWMRHDEHMLNSYLVSSVEDPRTNIQSILTRHFLIVALFDKRFAPLLEPELRFALVMNWLRLVFEGAGGAQDLHAIRHALATGADDAEGLAIPGFVSATGRSLPTALGPIGVPDYLGAALQPCLDPEGRPALSDDLLSTFQRLWARVLQPESPRRVSVLEVACGSANDYRCIHAYGLGRLIDYTGLDLCPKNVRNARRMFPQANFQLGNVFALDWPDLAFDYCFVHDLFEHLSLEGLEAAMSETCRVARYGLSMGFFNLHEGDTHLVRPTGDYHWNTLSVPKLRDLLERHGFRAQVIHIDTFLRWRFGCDQTHNKNAYTFLAERPDYCRANS